MNVYLYYGLLEKKSDVVWKVINLFLCGFLYYYERYVVFYLCIMFLFDRKKKKFKIVFLKNLMY